MGLWAEINDFSEFDKRIPCVVCKGDSEKTVIGDHWKCQMCSHLFNQDGSKLSVECYCKVCKPEKKLDKIVKKVIGKKKRKKNSSNFDG